MEALAPGARRRPAAWCCDELPAGTHVVVCDPERVRTRAADLVRTSQEFLDASWAAAAGGGKAPIDLGAASLRDLDDVAGRARASSGCRGGAITAVRPTRAPRRGRQRVRARRPTYRGDTDAALHDLRGWTRDGWQVVLVFDGHGSAQRAVERLAAAEIPARLVAERRASSPASSQVTTGRLGGGLIAPTLKLAFLTEADLTGQRGVADPRHQPDAVAAAQRDRPDPARSPATSSCTSSTASAGTSRWCGARQRRRARVPDHRVRRRPRRASPATGCSSRPMRSTRSPSTSAARRRRCRGSAAPTGPRPRAAPARRSRRSPPS